MISPILRLLSIVASLAVVASFGAFASQQAGDSSKQTVAKIASADSDTGTDDPAASYAAESGASSRVAVPAGTNLNEPAPSRPVEKLREQAHGQMHELVDDANDFLTAPFKAATTGSSIWGQRIVTSLLALLVFGAGLGFAARYAASRGV